MKDPIPPELHIQGIKAVAALDDGNKIVVRADALVQATRTELEIAVTTDLAPTMALALLATTAKARATRDELMPAMGVMVAAVVRSSSADRVRLQLMFEKGVVLPIEMSLDAAKAFTKGLTDYLESPRRYVDQRNVSPPADASPDAPSLTPSR